MNGNHFPAGKRNGILLFPLLIVAAMACQSASGGSTDGSLPPDNGSTPESSLPTTKPPQGPQTNLLCQDPLPVELGLGGTVEGMIGDSAWIRCFWIVIPEGLDRVVFELGGLSADLNLSVGYGFLVTLQYHIGEFWRPGESGTADEAVIIDDPAPGPYFMYVGVAGPKEPSPFTLSVRAEPETDTAPLGDPLPSTDTCVAPATEVAVNSSTDSELPASNRDPLPRRYFCVQVPDGLDSLRIELTGLEDNLNLYVRRTQPAEWIDISRGGGERTVVIDQPAGGAYVIDIVGAYPGAGSPFTLLVSGQ